MNRRIIVVCFLLLSGLQANASDVIQELSIAQQRQLVQFARAVLIETVQGKGRQATLSDSIAHLQPNAGIFVTLMKNSKVRGCYGSLYAEGVDLESQIREYAVAAATRDFRHLPLHESELDDIVIILSFIGPLEPVSGMHEVDPKTEGLLIRTPAARAVLLPGEARTASWQLREARRQAGISGSEPVELYKIHTVTIIER
jgi:hypothetical protein